MNRRRLILGSFLLLLLLVGSGAKYVWHRFSRPSPLQSPIARDVKSYRFDMVGYELNAIGTEFVASLSRPGSRLTLSQRIRLVEQYQQRAQEIGQLEAEVERIYADPTVPDPKQASAPLRRRLQELRQQQKEIRLTVEAILQRQLRDKLVEEGLTTLGVVWPPPRFNFSEPPNYLIVSPRDRIELEVGVYLEPALDLNTIDQIETEIASRYDRSTLIEELGGLGVWPTMVLDRASLPWILSTIAHEWVHNYLVFHPLGWHITDNDEMNTINETVATIVGNEIGNKLAHELYGIPLPPPHPPKDDEFLPPPDSNRFDFRIEMRRTRLHVDELLAEGKVEEAEAYMEARRREFVDHGYYLRKLNQAYFAFHGAYATQPAASNPIGPKLQKLRAYTPDLATFMHAVQGIRRAEELDKILAQWQKRYEHEQLAQAQPAFTPVF